eukprot:CAMPEP_0198127372 /NCGR_PEP_ID=MMETSP1442-20131203/46979_1 /TAXON_ID= /ORGANISM="Craspedostauros australis, Strain CCMP3328" /LENGTH=42 /DNA_ID= /DNA_START= /DNA_END= /DNA_ORIENTATION=
MGLCSSKETAVEETAAASGKAPSLDERHDHRSVLPEHQQQQQ